MEITGIYEKTKFRDENSGYTVFTFNSRYITEIKDSSGLIWCRGITPSLTAGIPLKITGEVSKDGDDYFLNINSVEGYTDKETVAIQYLSGDLFRGIGEKTAEKIVKITGPNIFEFIQKENAEEILSKNISELKGNKLNTFISTLKSTAVQKEAYEYIRPFGGKYNHAARLFKAYGAGAISELKNDPYRAGRLAEMPFYLCDAIAQSLKISPYDERRLKSLIYGLLAQGESMGHTYLTLKEFNKYMKLACLQLADKTPIPLTLLVSVMSSLKGIKIEYKNRNVRIYNKSTYIAENDIMKNARRILRASQRFPFNPNIVDVIEGELGLSYSDAQRAAFSFLTSSGIKILTGGPGTGKSTVIKGLIKAYKNMFPENVVTLCAPTGRAAQRITESTGLPASTIHRLLDIKPHGDSFICRDKNNPIDSDFLIVDEASMADTQLMSLLLGAAKKEALIVIIGDVNQLPSVGPGNVLKDLIESGRFPVNQLKTIFRQSEGSDIVYNANAVINASGTIKEGAETQIIRVNGEEELHNTVLSLVDKYYRKDDPFNTQFLSSTKKKYGGTIHLNRCIQEHINSEEDAFAYNEGVFRLGDKVIMTRNNYEDNYFNGDMGIITEITSSSMVVNINHLDVKVSKENIKDVLPAYVTTVHKAQGSEHHTTVVILPQTPANMLQRNLLYTAITRAKKKLIIVSEGNALEIAMANNTICRRNTGLCEKLKKGISIDTEN